MKPPRSTAVRKGLRQASDVLPADPDVAAGSREDEALQREDMAAAPDGADQQRLDPAGAPGDERRQRIRELAYTLAAARGFRPGCELDDWLEAERQVDTGPTDDVPRTGP